MQTDSPPQVETEPEIPVSLLSEKPRSSSRKAKKASPKKQAPSLEVRPNRGPRKKLEQVAETKRRMTFHFASDVASKLMLRCALEDRSNSAVAEQAIEEYLSRHRASAPA